jgi:peptidyl-prolyl cis-trans isomerase D
MLQKIGDSLKGKRALAYLILIPLALVFAVWGAAGVVNLDFFGAADYAARVNGTKVPLQRVNEAWQDQQSRFQQQFAQDMPEETRRIMQEGLLEQFVREALVSERTADKGYRVSEARIQEVIQSEPAFQVDGKYNETLALSRLAQIGTTPERYRADLRASLQNRELQRSIQVSEFMTPREVARMVTLEDEQREVRYATIPRDRFESAVVVDDAAVADYYSKNAAQFQTAESVRLQFAELRLDQVAAQVTVAESDLQALYARDRDRYVDPEKRRARHVLIAAGSDDAAARRKAESVLAEARAGKDFAELARRESADSGSAAQGGDLGWSEKTVFVPEFAEALFKLKEGEITGPVKTQFGYHVIRLEGIQASRSKSFDEARGELESRYRRDRAAELFGDRSEQVQRRLEQPGADFEALAKELGLATGEVAEFARGTGGAPLGADRALEEIVFGDPVLNQRRIGGPAALGEDRFVIVRVLDHRKPAPRPLAEVRADIVTALRGAGASDAARKLADEAVRRLDAGEPFDSVVKAIDAAVEPARFIARGDPSLPAPVRELAFSLPRPGARPIHRSLGLDQGGAAVLELLRTRAAAPDGNAELRMQRVAAASERAGQGEVAAYVGELRRKADVKLNPQAFE